MELTEILESLGTKSGFKRVRMIFPNLDWVAISQNISQEMAVHSKKAPEKESRNSKRQNNPSTENSDTIRRASSVQEKENQGPLQPSFREIHSYTMLRNAWTLLKKPRTKAKMSRGAGVDGITMNDFEKDLDENLNKLCSEIRNKTYQPEKVKCVRIPKKNGDPRILNLPCTKDKIVQKNIVSLLKPIWESIFSNRSLAYRDGRSFPNDLIKSRALF